MVPRIAKQNLVYPLAAFLGGFGLHGEALDDAALLGFSALARYMSPADEVNNLANHLDFHSGNQTFADDQWFGKRRAVVILVAHGVVASQFGEPAVNLAWRQCKPFNEEG